MLKNILKIALLTICLGSAGESASAQQVQEPVSTPAPWSEAYQPFRIAGNLYYVGTYELACFLITTSQGHILINTGLASSASQIKANVEALGFKFSYIKILLNTQAHYDHMGAMAAVQKMTGAKVMINEKDAGTVKDGGRSDYLSDGTSSTFQPLKVDRLLKNNDVIKLGSSVLTMLHHPGHTRGSSSFLFTVKDDRRSYKVLIANLPSIVTEKKFSEVTTYPGMAKDYAYTLKAMKGISFDIWVASHAGQFGLHDKHKPGDAYNPAAFKDQKGYDAAIQELQEEFSEKLKNE